VSTPVRREAGPELRGEPWRVPGARGRRYAELPPALELERRVPRWLAALAVPEGEMLKAPDVFRLADVVVKLFTQPSLFGWLRAPRAVRSAERWFWAQPLRAPRPLLAAGRPGARASVLVREHVEGRTLRELWDAPGGLETRGEDELARFLAAMERHGVIHGDLHPRNLLWNGGEWILLDVDGLRHGLHDPRRVLVGQWARFVVHLGDERRVAELHRRACTELGPAALVPWEAVRRRVGELARRRGGVPPR
jgi:hypothetical protein